MLSRLSPWGMRGAVSMGEVSMGAVMMGWSCSPAEIASRNALVKSIMNYHHELMWWKVIHGPPIADPNGLLLAVPPWPTPTASPAQPGVLAVPAPPLHLEAVLLDRPCHIMQHDDPLPVHLEDDLVADGVHILVHLPESGSVNRTSDEYRPILGCSSA